MNDLQLIEEDAHDGATNQPFKLKYTQKAMVGHGSFGYVYQINIQPNNEKAAIKRVLQDRRFKNRELEIMKLINHKNIVSLLSYFYKHDKPNANSKQSQQYQQQSNNNNQQQQQQQQQEGDLYLYLILEFIPETLYKSSHYYLSKNQSMPIFEVKLYSFQLLRSLNYIHSMGICHRDIKPQNLLIDPYNCVLKLCDFGSAKILNPNEPNVSYICSRYYRAPELIFGSRNYTTKIDIWSAGCVISELLLGQPLFPGESGIDQLVEIIKVLGTPTKEEIKSMNSNYMEHQFPDIKSIPLNKIFKIIDNDCIELLKLILNYSPIKRIDAINLLNCKFFNDLKVLYENQYMFNDPYILPDTRFFKNANQRFLPNLFDFNKRELSMFYHSSNNFSDDTPSLLKKLLPFNDTNYKDFVPLSKEELLNPSIN